MYERRHHYQHLPAFALASVHEMGKGRDMSNPNDPMYPGRTHAGMTIRQSFVMEAMGKLAAKFTEYERTDSGTRVCPENFETRSKEVAKIACLYADAALAEEARTRSKA